jgi:hypothetical protein
MAVDKWLWWLGSGEGMGHGIRHGWRITMGRFYRRTSTEVEDL